MTYTERDCVKDTRKHIREVQNNLTIIIAELLERLKAHDDSKFSDIELETYTRVTPRLKNLEYGSQEYKDNIADLGAAVQHHYQNNRHHPEYCGGDYKNMDLVDLVEMLMDWLAATKRHTTGNIYKSIKVNQERFGYGDDLAQIFNNTISRYFPDPVEERDE